MQRREFVSWLAGAAAWPLPLSAQQSGKVAARIGFLGASSRARYDTRVEAFRAGLRDLGYVEGRDCLIEYRWAEERYDRLADLAAELVRINVDLIVTHGTPAILAAKRATTAIPIVMATSGDAETSGLVASISRPGGNVTGLTFFNPELVAKRIEFLKEVVPRLTEVGILTNPENPVNNAIAPAIKLAAGALGVELQQFDVQSPNEFESAFSSMAAKRVGALVVIDDAMLISNANRIAEGAANRRLPSGGFTEFAQAGGLIGYGVNFLDMFRRAATFVDKILRGVKPAELPIERSTKFEVVVNLKTAKALGIEMPIALLLRADQVIE
jgi:putative tryptophan/tyrosine transport system substrate-binding protein